MLSLAGEECYEVVAFSFVFQFCYFFRFCQLRDKQFIDFHRLRDLRDSIYFPTWLVPEFLSSIIHLKCLLNLVLIL